ncbi:nucleotidyl transferase domain protein [Campylobacter iguaniorum]|uniref:nucleotidyltransferase domain-containing protein n=1 Tax=Campylobacter iguaniorum TaxID=1244531 RepID=UPI0007C94F95|nr:nucleotidyltransferase domain-containing protein [Campylobacter iguaniorum]ANE35240.1 nucleotidyl transferase domain protein [Campylobacter iguaniorum]
MENLVNLPPKTKDELVSKLKELNPLEIWLFGSYAKGVPTSSSDTKSNIRQKIALGDEFYSSVFKTAQKIYTKKGKQYIWLNKMGKFDNLISKVARWLVLVEKNYPI